VVTAKFKYLLVCETAQLLPDNKGGDAVMILQPIMKKIVPFVPTQLTFSVAGGIIDLEQNSKHMVKITMTDPNGVEKEVATAPIEVGVHKRKDAMGMGQIGFEFRNFEIYHEGLYIVKAYLDNVFNMEYSFEVLVRED